MTPPKVRDVLLASAAAALGLIGVLCSDVETVQQEADAVSLQGSRWNASLVVWIFDLFIDVVTEVEREQQKLLDARHSDPVSAGVVDASSTALSSSAVTPAAVTGAAAQYQLSAYGAKVLCSQVVNLVFESISVLAGNSRYGWICRSGVSACGSAERDCRHG